MTIADYSTTPASNNSTPPFGFPEGMAPSDVNNSARQVMADVRSWYNDAQWVDLGDTPTQTDVDTFTLSGDKTIDYHVGRRAKFVNFSTDIVYGRVVGVSFTSATTTVDVELDAGSLDSNLNQVFISAVSFENPSVDLNMLGGFANKVVDDGTSVTSRTIFSSTDSGKLFTADTSSTSRTFVLPAASEGGLFGFKKTSGSNTATITLATGDDIDNTTGSKSLSGDNDYLWIKGDSVSTYNVVSDSGISPGADNAFTGDNTFAGSSTFNSKVAIPDGGELTVSSGSVTATSSFHTVDTESDASTDDLDTINGGTDGYEVTLMSEDSGRDVTLTSSGNILLSDGAEFTFNTANDLIMLKYVGALSKWVEFGRRKNTSTFTKFMVGSFTRDVSTASGNQAVTGVGFTPRAILFTGAISGDDRATPMGMSDGSNRFSLFSNNTGTANNYGISASAAIVFDDSGASYVGDIGSLDSDGFTIAWVKSGSPTGTATIGYIAIA